MTVNILLFDMHVAGHHLEYAQRLQTGLRDRFPDATVDFLVAAEVDRHSEFFESTDFEALFDDRSIVDAMSCEGVVDNLARVVRSPRDRIVKRLFDHVDSTEYDIVHLLHADDILKEVHRHGQQTETTVLGTLNGLYFKTQTWRRTRIARRLVDMGLTESARLVPDILSRRGPWNHLNLRRSVRDGVLDDLFVATEVGREAIRSGTGLTDVTLPVVPDPVDPWYEMDLSQTEARERLGLPTDAFVLTFFGGMRQEKGIDLLLEALAEYDGEPLTATFAGSPVDLTEEAFEPVRRNPAVDVKATLEFVAQDEVPSHFFAADVMAVPYRRSFGRFRPSNIFQKSCSAGRPVIAPAFGAFEDLVAEWEVGVTFQPGSVASLRKTIEYVRSEKNSIYNKEKMREYAESQTYERLLDVTAEEYNSRHLTHLSD